MTVSSPTRFLFCVFTGFAVSNNAQAFDIVDVADFNTINPISHQPFGEMGYTNPATDGKHVVFNVGASVWTTAVDGSGLTLIAEDGYTSVPKGKNVPSNSALFVNTNFGGPPRLDQGKVVFTGQDAAGNGEYGFFSGNPAGGGLKVIYAEPPATNPFDAGNDQAYFWAQGGVIAFFGKAGPTSGGNWVIQKNGAVVQWLAQNGNDQCSGFNTGLWPISNWSEPFTDGKLLIEVGSNTFNYPLIQGNTIANFTVAGPTSTPPGPCVVKYYDAYTLPGQPQYAGYVPTYENLVESGGNVYFLGIASDGNNQPGNGASNNTYGGIFEVDPKTQTVITILDNLNPAPLPGFTNGDGTTVAPINLAIQSFSVNSGRMVIAVNNGGNGGSGHGYAAALYEYYQKKFTRIVGTGETLPNGFAVVGVGLQPYALSSNGYVAFWLDNPTDFGYHNGTFVTLLK